MLAGVNWTAVGDQDVDIDLASTPLQILTDSKVGSEEVIWIAFYDHDFVNYVALEVKLTSPPTYNIRYCEPTGKTFDISAEDVNIVWTFEKNETVLKLSCNNKEIFAFDTSISDIPNCKSQWSMDLRHIRFTVEDTASDFYRRYINGGNSKFEVEVTYYIDTLEGKKLSRLS